MFVHDLFGVYCHWAAFCGLKGEILLTDDCHCSARFSGSGAAQAFQHETGKHSVQRVPATESKGRRQTSLVSVAVLPLPPEISLAALPDSELNIKTQCGHGPGGQHQNKTASAVRMTHRPIGIQVFINGKDQHSNKREARRILTARVRGMQADLANADNKAVRRAHLTNTGRGDKIRTWNSIEGRIADHRLAVKTRNVKEVMKGRLDCLFDG